MMNTLAMTMPPILSNKWFYVVSFGLLAVYGVIRFIADRKGDEYELRGSPPSDRPLE